MSKAEEIAEKLQVMWDRNDEDLTSITVKWNIADAIQAVIDEYEHRFQKRVDEAEKVVDANNERLNQAIYSRAEAIEAARVEEREAMLIECYNKCSDQCPAILLDSSKRPAVEAVELHEMKPGPFRATQPGHKCAVCGNPATCFGVYEDPEGPVQPACDDCCGHGGEDGWCKPIAEYEAYQPGDGEEVG